MRSDRQNDEDENRFDEPTIEGVSVPVTSGIKPEVAAALAGLKRARPITGELAPPSPSPSPSASPPSSAAPTPSMWPQPSPSWPKPAPSWPSSLTASGATPRPPSSPPAGWSPPHLALKPLAWAAFIVAAVVVVAMLLRPRPASLLAGRAGAVEAVAVPDLAVPALDGDALSCTSLTVSGRHLHCGFSPQQFEGIAEAEQYSRLEATRTQAAAAGFARVVLVDRTRAWRVLHAEIPVVPPRAPRAERLRGASPGTGPRR